VSTLTAPALASRLLSPELDGRDPTSLADHLALRGELPPLRGDDAAWVAAMLQAVADSGLSGRGGAGFPSARKLAGIRRAGGTPLVVVNAMEGEPESLKDKVLLTAVPHLVLDGAAVAAALLGARRVVVCLPADDPSGTAEVLRRAVAERARAGRSGVEVVVAARPGGYAAGEESALVEGLNDRPGLPIFRADKATPLRVGRAPALVHNAETLAHLALIARHGAAWFRSAGTAASPGTTLVTVAGAVVRPGVFEVELGCPIDVICAAAGAPDDVAGVLVGGYAGTWLGPQHLGTPFERGALAELGATTGVGVLVVLAASSCGITETARIARYMAGESAGQCGPCVFGLPALAEDLELLAVGRAGPTTMDRLRGRASLIAGRGACRHPDGVVRLVESALVAFADDLERHARGHACRGTAAPSVLNIPRNARPGRRAA